MHHVFAVTYMIERHISLVLCHVTSRVMPHVMSHVMPHVMLCVMPRVILRVMSHVMSRVTSLVMALVTCLVARLLNCHLDLLCRGKLHVHSIANCKIWTIFFQSYKPLWKTPSISLVACHMWCYSSLLIRHLLLVTCHLPFLHFDLFKEENSTR
jgi:hypothetical protein